MSDSQEELESDMEWSVSEYKSRKRKKRETNAPTALEIQEIIIGHSDNEQQKSQQKKAQDKDNQNKNSSTQRNTTKNYSLRMKEIVKNSTNTCFI